MEKAPDLRDEGRAKIADGIDPLVERKKAKAKAKVSAENILKLVTSPFVRNTVEHADGFAKLFAAALGFATNPENRQKVEIGAGVAPLPEVFAQAGRRAH
ncbi:MAG: hypothetical protein AAFX04_10780 [Pseudomonadota bacterium]